MLGVIESTSGLSEVLTSEAIKTNSKWPFMTLSSFEVFVKHTRVQASSELIVVAPIVQPTQLEDWATYSINNQGWIDESFAVYGNETVYDLNPIPSSAYRFGRFKGRTVLKPEDGADPNYPVAPFWQMSRPPFDTSIVNYNSLSVESYQQMYDAMMSSRSWVMGEAGPNILIDYTISQLDHDILHSDSSHYFIVDEESEDDRNENDNGEDGAGEDDEGLLAAGDGESLANFTDPELLDKIVKVSGFANDHPHTSLMYPVYEKLEATPNDKTSNNDSKIVAMVINVLPWDNYLKNSLPEGVNGIYCVLHNSKGQIFTYVINGNYVKYLGEGDYHETQYDDMAFTIDLNDDLFAKHDLARQKDLELDGNYEYWFVVYPSYEFHEVYLSDTPMHFAIIAGFAFLFMTATFILYDLFVIRKNNKILDAAARSNAILSVRLSIWLPSKLCFPESPARYAPNYVSHSLISSLL